MVRISSGTLTLLVAASGCFAANPHAAGDEETQGGQEPTSGDASESGEAGDGGTVTGDVDETTGAGCEAPQVECSGSCVDTQTDAAHCGTCESACSAGEACSAGVCVPGCGDGLTACGEACVDTQTNPDHCGSCGSECLDEEVCSEGTCASSCTEGTQECDGGCFDTDSSTTHCGECGLTCGGGWSCEAGACEDERQWGLPVLVENSEGVTRDPAIAMDSAGNAIVVWQQEDDPRDIWANRYDAGSASWGTPVIIDNTDVSVISPKVGMDDNGNAIAVWAQSDGMNSHEAWANRYDANSGSWETAQMIETDSAGSTQAFEVAVTPDGDAIAVWRQYDDGRGDIWANHYDSSGASWGLPELIEENDAGSARDPHVAAGRSGSVMAVWVQDDGSTENVWANRFRPESDSWAGVEVVGDPDAGRAGYPHVAMDAYGNAIAVWQQNDDIRHNLWSSRYDAETTQWSSPILVEAESDSAVAGRIAVDGFGNAVAVWIQADDIWANQFRATNESWSTAQRVASTNSDEVGGPTLGLDETGNAVVVWAQRDGANLNMWANRLLASTNDWATPELIEADSGLDATWYDVAVAPNGNAIAVWSTLDLEELSAGDLWSNRLRP